MRNLGQYFPLWARWISAAITFLAVAMLILALVLGVRAGQQQLEIKRRQQLSVILQQALEFHNEGRIEAARIAYQEILLLDPDNVAAVDGLAELRTLPSNAPTPNIPTPNIPTQSGGSTAQVVPLNTATTPPLPTTLAAPTAEPAVPPTSLATNTASAAAELARAQEVFAAGRWTDAIERLLTLRAGDPTYERAAVNDLLFEAYVNLATEKDNQNKLQEALTLFDQALALQPDALDIRAERRRIGKQPLRRCSSSISRNPTIEMLKHGYNKPYAPRARRWPMPRSGARRQPS
jgi:tetratricopeptide (TPR) repeat protein